jgi:bifunctional non-homologous end joining protein LigD
VRKERLVAAMPPKKAKTAQKPARKSTKTKSALERYQAKRDFTRTAEPRGSAPKASGTELRYLIQKHAARRLHYDFRLELDGTLKSWAVTKGPSLNPADKRLAVHVEDHPLEYGSFEGTIPQGQYGGGTVMLWDEGTWEPIGDAAKAYSKGRLSFILNGKRLKGEWHLVRMGSRAKDGKRDNWLLIKSRDRYANEDNGDRALERYQKSAASNRSMEAIAKGKKEWTSKGSTTKATSAPRAKKTKRSNPKERASADEKAPPAFIAPELATLVSDPPSGDSWVHEIKFDGYRALCRIADGRVKLLTRNNKDWTDKFKFIADQMAELDISNSILDGEITTIDESGAMSFSALQQALGNHAQDKLHYYLFDALYLHGEDLRDKPLLERKEALRALIPSGHTSLHYSEHFVQPGPDVLQHACHIALEGIISKRAESPYQSGRNDAWLKSKCVNEQEFVIGGYTRQPKHPDRLAALLIGVYDKKQLIFAGKVGTGFDRKESSRLLKVLGPLEQRAAPFANVPNEAKRQAIWVKPTLVAQVNFAEWTRDNVLRHPSYQGLREDKPTEQVTRETRKRLVGGTNGKGDRMAKVHKTKKADLPVKPNVIAGVALTHPEKVLYPEQNLTKQDLAEYYEQVAGWMLPHVAGRPISLVRFPAGEGKPCFFQRHGGEGKAKAIHEVDIDVDSRAYITIDNLEGLISLVQMGVLEIHVWGCRADKADQPDRIVFDFDPHEDVPWETVKDAAREMRQRLKKLELESFLKTTGGKGLHVVAPIARKPDWPTVKDFAHKLAQQMAGDAPELFTTNSRKAERKGRIFIDYLRNDKTASAIAPYSTRAREGASIAVPLAWEELAKLPNAHSFTIERVEKRLKALKSDPWKDIEDLRQSLPKLRDR